ncbi:hypothetical protein Syun_018324 [Stephania yunnanensis]|uniref:Uncharacterized protein n=1 Tax=Stephania yunnanensis TaxID=152371 RepID=A0AAP0ITY3_9MAGN
MFRRLIIGCDSITSNCAEICSNNSDEYEDFGLNDGGVVAKSGRKGLVRIGSFGVLECDWLGLLAFVTWRVAIGEDNCCDAAGEKEGYRVSLLDWWTGCSFAGTRQLLTQVGEWECDTWCGGQVRQLLLGRVDESGHSAWHLAGADAIGCS